MNNVHITLSILDPDCGLQRDSRYFVGVVGGDFVVAHLAGPAAPANALVQMLVAAAGFTDEELAPHQARKRLWRVESRVGMSGCRDYFVRWVRRPDLGDYPHGKSFHVSMVGSLNADIRVPLVDAIPIVSQVLKDYPAPDDEYSLRVEPAVPLEEMGAWQSPGPR